MDIKYADYRDVAASVNLDFSLWHNQLEVKSLQLTSEKSSLEAKGKINDFKKPEINATYGSSLDLKQVGAIVRDLQLRGGTAQMNGTLSYSEVARPATTGSVLLRELDYVDAGLAVRKANLSSNFSLAKNQLQLTGIAARLLGGDVTGQADVRNVIASEAPAPQPVVSAAKGKQKRGSAPPVPSNVQEGAARLRVSGVSLNEVARTFSTRAMPLDKLNAVGRVRGDVNLTWKQSIANAVAELALDSAASAQGAANQLPVNGSLRGRYNAGFRTYRHLVAQPHYAACTGECERRTGLDDRGTGCNPERDEPERLPAVAYGVGGHSSIGDWRQSEFRRHGEWSAARTRHRGTR